MTISASTKIRVITGASALALSVSLTGTALAQMAPAPLIAAPTPTAPVAPANAQECAVVAGTITCAPGTDADGFTDLSDDPFGLDVQSGSVVQGPIIVTGTVLGTVDGSIQTSNDFDGGLAIGADSEVTIGGFVQTTGQFSVGVEVGDNASLTNDGTIYTSGDNFSDAISLATGATFTNNGLVQSDGSESFGIFGAGDGITVVNAQAGTIVTSGEGSFGVAVLNDADIQNDGLIQTFGDFAIGVDTQENGTVTNSGNIVTSGASAFGVGMRNDAVFTNTATGVISTSGDEARGVSVLLRGTLVNDGTIMTSGEEAVGVFGFADTNITNNGSILTTGDNVSDAVTVRANGVVTNTGLIQTDGAESSGVFGIGANVTVNNSATGEIIANGIASFGVLAVDDASVQNDGLIQTAGDFGIAVDLQENGTVVNNGTIQTGGDFAYGVGLRDNSNITNGADGFISTAGVEARGISVLVAGTIVNDGMITTSGDTANGVRAGADSVVTNNGTILTTGNDAADAVELRLNAIVNNAGLIQTEGESSIGVLGRADGVTINNSADGEIVTTGDGGFAISLRDGGIVQNDGAIETSGLSAIAIDAEDGASVTNTGSITTAGDLSIGVNLLNDASFTNAAGASVSASGEGLAGVIIGDNSTANSDGTIATTGDNAIGIIGGEAAAVTLGANSVLSTQGEFSGGVVVLGAGNVSNAGSITTQGDGAQAVTITGASTVDNSGSVDAALARGFDLAGLSVFTNTGTVNSGGDDAVRFGADGSSLNNSGAISTAGAAAFGVNADSLGDLTITNTGTISSAFTGIAADGGTITNAAGGVISGDQTAIISSAAGALNVVNSGAINSAGADAVSLGEGADSFAQNMGATVTGNINLDGGDDTFILAWNASSIAGTVDGGAGTDTAVLGGTLDADNLVGFESSTLGTQSDLRVSGARTLQGDVTIEGNVTLGLGVDSLTSTGAMVLEETGTITIETPLDVALVGQTVLVLQDGAGFTDNGGTINIIDDDLLVDYVPIVGSLSVQVNAVNQLITSQDTNLITFGAAVTQALNAGTLSQANFDLINGLPDTGAFETLALDALPSLSDGAAREIFETSSAASDALNRHLLGDASGIWGEFILRGAEQDGVTSTSGGYESDQTIFTVGGDFVFGEMGRIGLLASYAEIENDDFSGAALRGQTDVENIKVGGYIATSFAERGFLNGEVAYLTGEVDDARSGLLGAVNSSYDFDGFAYSAAAGYDLLPDANVSLTPSVGINGANLSFDDTVEAGGFGLAVARSDADFLELRGGVELAGQVSPRVNGFVRGTVIHDLEDDARSFNLSSAELGAFTVALPEREQNRFELAAGASVDVSENFSVELGYLGDYSDGYDAHSAKVTARLAF